MKDQNTRCLARERRAYEMIVQAEKILAAEGHTDISVHLFVALGIMEEQFDFAPPPIKSHLTPVD